MKSRGSGNPGKLSEHFSSKAHNAAFRDYAHFISNNSQVDSLLDTEVRGKVVQLQEDKENNRAIIKLIIDLCRTMARQGTLFWGTQSDADSNFAQLLSFTPRHCPKLKQSKSTIELQSYLHQPTITKRVPFSTRYGSKGKNSHRHQRRWSFFHNGRHNP